MTNSKFAVGVKELRDKKNNRGPRFAVEQTDADSVAMFQIYLQSSRGYLYQRSYFFSLILSNRKIKRIYNNASFSNRVVDTTNQLTYVLLSNRDIPIHFVLVTDLRTQLT